MCRAATGICRSPGKRSTGDGSSTPRWEPCRTVLPRVFRTIAEAVAPLDAQLVIALGGSKIALPTDLPGDPIVARFAPQVELLRRSSVAVLHAGLNGTLEALTAGVPIVALPIANDQPGVAARVLHSGTGRILHHGPFGQGSRFGVRSLRAAVADLLDDKAQRTHCRVLAARIAAVNGLERAVSLIEEHLLRTPPPSLHDVRRIATILGGNSPLRIRRTNGHTTLTSAAARPMQPFVLSDARVVLPDHTIDEGEVVVDPNNGTIEHFGLLGVPHRRFHGRVFSGTS